MIQIELMPEVPEVCKYWKVVAMQDRSSSLSEGVWGGCGQNGSGSTRWLAVTAGATMSDRTPGHVIRDYLVCWREMIQFHFTASYVSLFINYQRRVVTERAFKYSSAILQFLVQPLFVTFLFDGVP